MTKYFVLRPHALLSSLNSTQRFGEDNVVVVPMAILDEISSMKDLSPAKDRIRREVLRYIRSLLDKGVLTDKGYRQENGSILRVVKNYRDIKVELPDINEFQKRTLQVCLGLKKDIEKEDAKVVLVTNNIALQIKAYTQNIDAEEFKDEIFPVLEEQYTGRMEISVSKDIVDKLYKDDEIVISEIHDFNQYNWINNCYVIAKAQNTAVYCQVKGDKLVKNKYSHNKAPMDIKPKNDGQRLMMNALYDDTPLTIIKGCAGTGKTLCSLASGLDMYENNRKYPNGILITKKVSNGSLGYLPGNVAEKMGPFLESYKDNLSTILHGNSRAENSYSKTANRKGNDEQENGDYYFETGEIKIQALEMLRGRSITDTFFIIDEAQNIEPEFIKTIVTRAAVGSKFIIMGDPTQIDNPRLSERYNGLTYVAEKWKGHPLANTVSLSESESVRSELARVASQIL